MIEANDKTYTLFTGLPSWVVFFHLYMFLSPLLTAGRSNCALSMENELFLVLVKLRLNLLFEDIAIVVSVFQLHVFLAQLISGWK